MVKKTLLGILLSLSVFIGAGFTSNAAGYWSGDNSSNIDNGKGVVSLGQYTAYPGVNVRIYRQAANGDVWVDGSGNPLPENSRPMSGTSAFLWTTDPGVKFKSANDYADAAGQNTSNGLACYVAYAGSIQRDYYDNGERVYVSYNSALNEFRGGNYYQNTFLEILNKTHNSHTTGTGFHRCLAYHDYVNIGAWYPTRYMVCEHNQSLPVIKYYDRRNNAEYRYNNEVPCPQKHLRGYFGICADCGKRVTALTYATPDTIATIRRVKNGTDYAYFCAETTHVRAASNNSAPFNTSFISNHTEQWAGVCHDCTATCLNQYAVKFNSNLPSWYIEASDEGLTYVKGNYFYKKNSGEVWYASYGKNDWVRKTCENALAAPEWNLTGLIFDGWYTAPDGGVKVTQWYSGNASDTTALFNSVSDADLAKDMTEAYHPINVYAHWRPRYSYLKTMDGATVLNSYTLACGQYQVIPDPTRHPIVVSYDYVLSGVTGPDHGDAKWSFREWSERTSNKNGFLVEKNKYRNLRSSWTEGWTDYLDANWTLDGVILPSPQNVPAGNAFEGWYTAASGGTRVGGAGEPYTPSSNITLYAHYVPVDITITAVEKLDSNGRYTGYSDVRWEPENAHLLDRPYYKVWKRGYYYKEPYGNPFTSLIGTGSDDIVDSVEVANYTKNGTADSTYTAPYNGYYYVTLVGAKGGTSGGNGGKEEIRVFLEEGDVLYFYIGKTDGSNSYSSTFSNLAGGAGAKSGRITTSKGRGNSHTYTNGGGATALYVKKSGDSTLTLLAVAGGGGGYVSSNWNGTTYTSAGGSGGAVEETGAPVTTAVTKTDSNLNAAGSFFWPSDAGRAGYGGGATPYYPHVSSGGGGGYYQSGNLYGYVEWLDYDHTCYWDSAHISKCWEGGVCGQKGTWAITAQAGGISQDAAAAEGVSKCSCGAATCTNKAWACTCPTHHTQFKWDYNWTCDGCGRCLAGAGTDAQIQAQARYCDAGSYQHKSSCYQHKVAYSTTKASKGGANYANTTYTGLVYSHASAGVGTGGGSWSVTPLKIGFTTSTRTDTYTPDKKAPTTPEFYNVDKIRTLRKVTNSDGTVTFYADYVAWTLSSDLGTLYNFWAHMYSGIDIDPVAESNTVGLTITSGVRNYYYYFTNSSSTQFTDTDRARWHKVSVEDGPVSFVNHRGIPVVANASPGTSGTIWLHIVAEDWAGNVSDVAHLDIDWEVDGHIAGYLNPPRVSSQQKQGVYSPDGGNTFYVKADGKTSINVKYEASLKRTYSSRISKVSGGGFTLAVDALTREGKANGTIEHLIPTNDPCLVQIFDAIKDSQSTVTASRDFTTTLEETSTVTAYAYATCIGQNEDGLCDVYPKHELEKTGNTIFIIGDKTSPDVTFKDPDEDGAVRVVIGDENVVHYAPADNQKIDITLNDDGSGVKTVIVRKDDENGDVVSTKTYVNTNTVDFTYNPGQGTYKFFVEVVDNVGNKTTVTVYVNNDKTPIAIEDKTDLPDDKKKGDPVDSHPIFYPEEGKDNSAIWVYDWVDHDVLLSYLAWGDNHTFGNVASPEVSLSLFAADESFSYNADDDLIAVGNCYISTERNRHEGTIEHLVTTEGTTYYVLLADNGHYKTTIYIIVRVDKSPVGDLSGVINSILSYNDVVKPKLKDLTVAEVNAMFESGDTSYVDTVTFTAGVTDLAYTADRTDYMDTSGVRRVKLTVSDADDPTIAMSWWMNPINGGQYAWTNTLKGTAAAYNPRTCFLTPDGNIERYCGMFFTKSVNIGSLFIDSAEVIYKYEVEDNVGHITTLIGERIPNFDIKAVDYMVEEDDATHSQTVSPEFNVPTSGGISNVGYYKTGEWGYVEVWTVGKVDSVRFDFGVVGEESFNEVDGGALAPKYLLGWDGNDAAVRRINSNPNQYDVPAYGVVETSPGVYASVAMPQGYARHYVFKGNPLGAENTEGWLSDGTNIMIPPNYQLQVKRKLNGEVSKDAAGNAEYEWEYRIARVYAEKSRSDGSIAEIYDNAYYVIWDGAGDDLHYRITHETPGTESHTGE